MSFLNPTYLWGLLALAIPIVIHLWSRKKVRIIKVGSIQFISETQSRQRKSIQLNEWWLLALRCLAIAMLVFILAEPHLKTTTQQDAIAYIFEPSLLSDAQAKALFKEIPEDNWRLLASGFPAYEPDQELYLPKEAPNYWQLAKEMEQLSADSIVVFTNAFAKGLQGKRPTISGNINWVNLEVVKSISSPIRAIKNKDSLEVLTAESDGDYLAFAKAKAPMSQFRDLLNTSQDSVSIQSDGEEKWLPVGSQTPVAIQIIYDDSLKNQLPYLEASFRAIASYLETEINVEAIQQGDRLNVEETDYVIWLSGEKAVLGNQKTLLLKPNNFAEHLIEPGNTLGTSYLTAPLTIHTIQNQNLGEELLKWLDLNTDVESVASKYDRRTMDDRQFTPKTSISKTTTENVVQADVSTWFWLLLGILLIAERVLARFRKQ